MSSAAKDYFKKGELAARKQNWEYAIELYLQGLLLDPGAAAERRTLHKIESLAIQEKGGNPQGGLRTKLRAGPMLTNAKKLTLQKKWDEAAFEYERCLRLQPQNVPTLFNLAEAMRKGEHADAAISTFEEIVSLDKSNVEAYRQLGQLWAEQGDPEKAIAYWEKVKQYKPEDKEAGKAIRDLSAATMVKKAEERKKETGDESFKAMLKSEDEAADLEKKARTIRTDEDRIEAIKFKTEDLRKDPTNSRLWRELGSLYQDLKQWVRAEKAYRKALEVNPHDLFAAEKIGVLKESRLAEEVKELEVKLNAAGTNGNQEAESIRQQLEQKQEEYAQFKVDEYARRVKAHPTDYELKLRFGRVLMEARKYDDAIEQFQKAVKDPKFKVSSHNLIGKCFESKELYDLADTQYREALKGIADPDSDLAKEVKYNLGGVAEKRGDSAAALEWFQAIMSTDISYRDVSDRVSRLMRNGADARSP